LMGTMGSLSCRCGCFAPRRRCQLRWHSITIPVTKRISHRSEDRVFELAAGIAAGVIFPASLLARVRPVVCRPFRSNSASPSDQAMPQRLQRMTGRRTMGSSGHCAHGRTAGRSRTRRGRCAGAYCRASHLRPSVVKNRKRTKSSDRIGSGKGTIIGCGR
jgi:hypothetical protein